MLDPASLPVPPAVAARARELAAGRVRPAEPRPAATVVLLRDGPPGLELYLIRRRSSMAFAAGMYAFPGGRVDAGEDSRTAALRELFEETSVLLVEEAGARARSAEAGHAPAEAGNPPAGDARRGPSVRPVDAATLDALDAERQAVADGTVPFAELLERHGMVPRPQLLVPAAHWVTPEAEERRYDTHFYLAAMPLEQRARDVSGEADRAAWWTPRAVAEALEDGRIRMMPPTIAVVGALAAYPSVAEALADAATWDIRTIRPTVGFDVDGRPRWQLEPPTTPDPETGGEPR